MTFFAFRQTTAILILTSSLTAAQSLAQSSTNENARTSPATTPAIQGKVVEDIVARVNDQIVTQSDYDRAAEQLEVEAKQQNASPQDLAQKKQDLLRDLIDKQLLLSKGKELGITGETDLIKQLDELRKQNHLDSMEDLEKAYAAQAQGTSFEDFKASMRDRIVTQQVVRDEVGRHITINPADVQKYYKEHESEFAQPESVTLNEILIPTPGKGGEAADADEVAAAQAKADALEAKLTAGTKFEDLAKPAPTDPLEPKSVSLGEFHRDQLAKEISDKAFALEAGQHTQPIRTKQGFIILQATDHNLPGDAGFKKAEPQVEEAVFLDRMQPALRTYLTKLREEAYVDLKSGVVDTGSTPNEMRLSYSAYTPPAPKKKVKFARARFRGRDRSRILKTAAVPAAASTTPAAGGAAPAADASTTTAANTAATPPATAKAAPTQQASNNTQGVEKPGKKEKIRFGQAPRESLPNSQVAAAVAPDNTPGVTTPETRVVNPDGTISGAAPSGPEHKTRMSNRPVVKKVKTDKNGNTTDQPTAEELATQKVQNSPLGLADPNAKKAKKTDKTRLSEKPKEPDQAAPYLGQPAAAAPSTSNSPDATRHPDPATNPPAPATGPPDPIPPGAQQP